jgi:hypothetical protein
MEKHISFYQLHTNFYPTSCCETEEIIGDHHCGLQSSRSTTDHMFCFHQILERQWEYDEAIKKGEYDEAIHQLLISNFRSVLNVECYLMDYSPASVV